MAKLTNEQIIEALGGMTGVELNELSKAIQGHFGIEGMQFASGGGGGSSEAATESVDYDVKITVIDNKMAAIKFIKTFAPNFGLVEAKGYVESDTRKTIGELLGKVLKKDEAEKLVAELKENGMSAQVITK